MNQEQQDIVQAAVVLDATCVLWYHVQFSPEQAQAFAAQTAETDIDMTELIAEIDSIMPKCDFQNGNHGKLMHTYTIGRENSRVVYVTMQRVYNVMADWNEAAQALETLAKAHGADEFSTDGDTVEFRVRLWWD